MRKKIIACLGSGDVKPDDLYYKAMVSVGSLLAEKKCIVVTGGFDGIMKAAAKGAIEAGGRTVGYTMLGRESNSYISTTVDCKNLLHPMMYGEKEEPDVAVQYGMRLGCLLAADGFIISAGGGPGAMTELMAIINLNSKIWKTPKRTAILNIDEAYFNYEWNARMLEELGKWGFFPKKTQKYFRIAATPEEAVNWVTEIF
ncbi:MAG: LOG family protein [Patescibacteria group bacterium]